MNDIQIQVPPAWEQLSLDRLDGTALVIGDTDTGKSHFARYLVRCLQQQGKRVALLDGDPGQSTLGPPATMTLAFPAGGQTWRWFVGDISPGRHLLAVLTGAARLVQAACETDAEAIVYDTTGLIGPANGGTALKMALIDLLRPAALFAFQRRFELEALLLPLRRSRRVRVVDLRPCSAVERRDTLTRQAHRIAQYTSYFERAQPLRIERRRAVILPAVPLFPGRLVALKDRRGFALDLGIVLEANQGKRDIVLQTPLTALDNVDILHPGDVAVDLHTFQDRRLTNRDL